MNERLFLNYVSNNLWAILPEKLEEFIVKVMEAYKEQTLLDKKVKADYEKVLETGRYDYDVVEGTAVISLSGVVEKKFTIWMYYYNEGVSTEFAQRTIEAAQDDSTVDRIVLRIDSPGGVVDGTKELSDYIYESRDKKPIYTYGDSLMASAAYWIGSAAKKVYTYDTAYIGSIGVYIIHGDFSGLFEKFGVKITHIQAGKYKTVGSPYKALTESDKEIIQERVDEVYDMFVEGVARNRGKDTKYVKENMAEGMIFHGVNSVINGLADELGVFEDILGLLQKSDTDSGNNLGNSLNLKQEESMSKITAEILQKNHPEVYNEIFEAGKGVGAAEEKSKTEEAISTAAKEALTGEQTRAKEILELADEGQKELALKLFSEGKSVEDAKTELLKDAQNTRAEGLKQFSEGAPENVPQEASASERVDEKLYLEDEKFVALYKSKGGKQALSTALKEWSEKAAYKTKYGGNLEAYLADRRNNPNFEEV